ncbi:MAG TPA: response regulator [Alphaproteobacteria bacterium]|nr:response regulator [Alphaproteobacteria bacterium]
MADKRLVVIDDEPDFGEYVREVAAGLGYDVAVTTRWQDFLDAYYDSEPTVIIVDMVLPDVEGIDLLEWLAEVECKAKIIVVSGKSPLYTRLAKSLGNAKGLQKITTMAKPVKLADLRAALS